MFGKNDEVVSSGFGKGDEIVTKQPQKGQLPYDRKSFIKGGMPTTEDVVQHPFKTGLRGLGAGFEVAEGIPSDILLAVQQNREKEIPKDIMSTLQGDRPAQYGDVFRQSKLPILSSEPVASTMGLLATLGKPSPTAFLGEGIAGGVSKIDKAAKISQTVSHFGKPFIAKALSVASRVPEQKVAQALDNPNMLSKSWLAKEGKEVSEMYKTEISPQISNTSNRIDTTKMMPELENIKLNVEGTTEATRQSTTMSQPERDKIVKWLDDIKSGNISLNKLDALIGEMDMGLGKVYNRYEKMKMEPVTRTFEALTSQMRKGLQTLRNTQYEQLAPKFERYENYKNAQKVYESFDKLFPKLYNLGVAELMLHFSGISGASWAGAATSPKLQSLGIQGITKGVNALKQVPTLAAEALVKTQ